MQKLGARIDRYSTIRNLVLAIIVAAISIALMGYLTQTLVYDVYGEANMPDTNLGYTYQQIMEAFSTLGSEGLGVWSQVHLLDLVFPLGYGFAMAIAIAMETKIISPDRIELRNLAMIPLLGATADYIENALVATQIAAYPDVSSLVVSVASTVTTVKWALIYLGFAVVLVLLILVIFKRLKR
ncbi:hypothetical protein EU538_08085 [Candidatus Thorarchaeota archaeon]|nr:MAG: hypothetical protein EU538_08085 [Candidatus Thorarchaeota archaeon]